MLQSECERPAGGAVRPKLQNASGPHVTCDGCRAAWSMSLGEQGFVMIARNVLWTPCACSLKHSALTWWGWVTSLGNSRASSFFSCVSFTDGPGRRSMDLRYTSALSLSFLTKRLNIFLRWSRMDAKMAPAPIVVTRRWCFVVVTRLSIGLSCSLENAMLYEAGEESVAARNIRTRITEHAPVSGPA